MTRVTQPALGFWFLAVLSGLTQASGATAAQSGDFAANLPVVTATVNRNEVQVAEALTLTISVIAPPGVDVEFPELVETLGPFQVVGNRDQFDVPVESGREWTKVYQLETLDTGSLQIPILPVTVGNEVLRTDSIPIQVRSVLEAVDDPMKYRDLKGIVAFPDEPARRSWIAWVVAGGLLLGAIGLGVILTSRRRQIAPDAWAYARLDELQRSSQVRGADTELLPAIADILRGYISRRFDVAAPQRTTTEFLDEVKHDPRLDEKQRRELQFLLRQADQVKFARAPDDTAGHPVFDQLRGFIALTTKQDAALAKSRGRGNGEQESS